MSTRDQGSYYEPLHNLTVSQLLLRYLKMEGMTKLFGIPGAANMYMVNDLRQQRDVFDFYISRQETGAAYMADGYYRTSGKPGVVLATSGPGATNALTGTMNAHCSHSAVLTITGEVAEASWGKGWLQEGIDADVDVNAIYANSSAYSAVITNMYNAATLFQQALRAILGSPARAAHISLPNDVAAACLVPVPGTNPPVPAVLFPAHSCNYRATHQPLDKVRLTKAFDQLVNNTYSLFFLGNDCRPPLFDADRRKRFRLLVDKWAIPVMTTADGKGLFPESHPMSLRNFGIANCEWPQYYLQPSKTDPTLPAHYEAGLVLGSSLTELATNSWNTNLLGTEAFIQVDMDPTIIGRALPVSMGIVSEMGQAIDHLCTLGDREPTTEQKQGIGARRELLNRIKGSVSPFCDPDKRNSDAAPIKPQALMKSINDAIDDRNLVPNGAHVFCDSGNCVGWCMNDLVIDPPNHHHVALQMGPMGFGVAAVVGGKIGAPDKTCIAVTGDGAFLMHGAEISTARQRNIGAIWIVLNDNNLLMVNQGENYFLPSKEWKDYFALGDPDLIRYAEGLGAQAYLVRSVDDARTALRSAIVNAERNNQPQVIVAQIDPTEMPAYPGTCFPSPPLSAPPCPPEHS
jgi:acetolactate synthase-1/2/3 large subunit